MTVTWSDSTVTWADPVGTWGGAGGGGPVEPPAPPPPPNPSVYPAFSTDGPVNTGYRFELLDNEENLIGELLTVTGGNLSWDAYASVKGGGTLDVLDDGTPIDWLNTRVRPFVLRTRLGMGTPTVETPLGVFLSAAPSTNWDKTGGQRSVEVVDKLSILDTDVPMDSSGLKALTYAVPAGANIVATVKALIDATGEATPAIQPSTKTLTAPIVWERGTTRLKIINDLLEVGQFFSLFCDGQGQYQVVNYVQPTDREPLYDLATPYSKGDNSLMAPAWKQDRNIYSIPNRYVVVTVGDGESEGLTATAVNVDPESPYSYAARGRWITQTQVGVDAADQAGLDAYARRQLSAATSVSSGINVSALYLPDVLINTVIRFLNPDAKLDQMCAVIGLDVPLDPVGLCSLTLLDVGPYVEVA